MSELTTFRWSFEKDVERIAAAGYTGIGVWLEKLNDYGIEGGIDLIARYGLQTSNLSWAGGFTGSDGRRMRETLRDTVRAIEIAGELRADCLVVHPGARAGHTWNHARRILTQALERVIPFAEEHNVILAIEPMHETCTGGCTFLTDLDDVLAVMDDLQSDRLKIVLDTYHLFHPEVPTDYLPRLQQLVSRIGVVHVADAKRPIAGEQNRCCLGDGLVPLREVLGRLVRAGYNGFFDVELLGEDVETHEYDSLLVDSKDILQELINSCGTDAP